MSEDEQRESKLPEYTAEDDPVLGTPKSRKGKTPRRQRQSPRASQRKFRAQWANNRSMIEGAILREAVTFALNARS